MRLGRVEMTGGFFLLLAWLNYLDRTLLVPLALGACAAHELGHIAAIRLLGGRIKLFRLTAVGAELVLERSMSYWQEGAAALAGPGVNLLLALACCNFQGGLAFSGINLTLALFNMLPAKRLDGGRALHCTLSLLTGPALADRISAYLDWLCTAVMLITGLTLTFFGGNITLMLAAFWLLAASGRANLPNFFHRRNNTCQRGEKKVQ